MALQNESSGAIRGDGAIGAGVKGFADTAAGPGSGIGLAEYGADIAGQIHGANNGGGYVMALQGPYTGLDRPQSGGLLAGERKTGTAGIEGPRDPAGDDAAQGAHGAVGGQRR